MHSTDETPRIVDDNPTLTWALAQHDAQPQAADATGDPGHLLPEDAWASVQRGAAEYSDRDGVTYG